MDAVVRQDSVEVSANVYVIEEPGVGRR